MALNKYKTQSMSIVVTTNTDKETVMASGRKDWQSVGNVELVEEK